MRTVNQLTPIKIEHKQCDKKVRTPRVPLLPRLPQCGDHNGNKQQQAWYAVTEADGQKDVVRMLNKDPPLYQDLWAEPRPATKQKPAPYPFLKVKLPQLETS